MDSFSPVRLAPEEETLLAQDLTMSVHIKEEHFMCFMFLYILSSRTSKSFNIYCKFKNQNIQALQHHPLQLHTKNHPSKNWNNCTNKRKTTAARAPEAA